MSEIAIVGLAARLPGARSADEFWENLKNGVESISRFQVEELEVPNAAVQASSPDYVKARSVLDDVDLFDAGLFGIYPQEAEMMDPQHRVFLECCWQAFEDAGYDPSKDPALTGVFAGCSPNSYFLRQVVRDRQYVDDYTSAYQVGFYPTMLGTIADTLATRVAYKLNLKGPAMTLLTACSTSLVAVCQAAKSLLMYECDMALAGGVSITFPQKRGYLHQAGGMVSPDGHCRPFDADAQGTVFGAGAGVVVLKRLEDAIADRDHIYAVIKGSAVNNDGAGKVGFTAPSVDGQAQVITLAQSIAGVDPASISYIEAHGTGTPLGDPIEVAALTQVFRASTQQKGFCAISTAKSNVGHLDVAAGVTGLIKTALSFEHRLLPPLLHFRTPNPRLDLANSPFYIPDKLQEWKPSNGNLLRAGVSAFGVGGTNAHVVLEEAPPVESAPDSRPSQLLLISGRSEQATANTAAKLQEHLENHPEVDLADASWTLATGRASQDYRQAWVWPRDRKGTPEVLRGKRLQSPSVNFLFPGQGTQYVDMGRELYASEPVFRQVVDDCAETLRPELGLDLRQVLYPVAKGREEARRQLNETVLAQPAIFTVSYALAQLWMHWGIRPKTMLGHSIGEFVAATLAGVFSLTDALRLVALRGRIMQAMPGGAMLSVRLPESGIVPMLEDGLAVAAVNSPVLTVVAGPYPQVEALEARLSVKGVVAKRLHTSHAFHSAMMDGVVEPFRKAVAEVSLHEPLIPFLSCCTGAPILHEEATSADYWARHLRQTVRFSDAVKLLRADAAGILLEVGPGTTLQVLSRQHTGNPEQIIVSSLPDPSANRSDCWTMQTALGRLWTAGVEPTWKSYFGDGRKRVALPGYAFERKRYWAENLVSQTEETPQLSGKEMEPIRRTVVVTQARSERIQQKLIRVFQDLSGLESEDLIPDASFLELGFDSLFLTQVTQSLQTEFGLKITFRQLMDEVSSIRKLVDYVDAHLPAEALPAPEVELPPASSSPAGATPLTFPIPTATVSGEAGSALERVMREQLNAMTQLMAQQLQILQGGSVKVAAPSAPTVSPAPTVGTQPAGSRPMPPTEEKEFKPFGPYKPIQAGAASGLTAQQQSALHALTQRYTTKTAGSKRWTQEHRQVLADPRVAGGFRLQWKELVYPIVTVRSHGSRLWDVDNNEYIDLLNGFGPTAFGHMPDFVKSAMEKQLKEGFEIGPQTPLAGDVANLISELTGVERVTFCNTGSEAVMAALRVARTVTGRKKIALFAGSYHGTFDEVLVKRVGKMEAMRSGPIAPGIPTEKVQNVLVLDYGDPASLEMLRKHGKDLAAVLVEPVQSRHPALQPKEFLHEVRRITTDCGAALILDEIVTGFRVHPGGVQKLFDIPADLVTYGKVLGGGMPIGVLAGKSAFMDALDGGMWQYGDDSIPEAGVTFFAGTFVRHPLALAAAKAVLEHLKEEGPALQERLTARTHALVERLNSLFERNHVPSRIETFGSIFYFGWPMDFKFGSLLYYLLRERGIHIQEGFPCFLTTAHSDEDLQRVYQAFEESVAELRKGGFLPGVEEPVVQAPILEAPITEAQLEVWLSAQVSEEASCSFNESFTVELRGDLNAAVLREAIGDLVNRHDALRATFDTAGRSARFAPQLNLEIPLIEADRAGLEQLVHEEAATVFDLEHGPLVRVKLVRLAEKEHVVLFTSHHIVCDGWSTNVLIEELGAIYSAKQQRKPATLLPAPRFAEYALAEHNKQASAEHGEIERYWLAQFQDPPSVLNLPTDRPRPAAKSYAGATLRKVISRDAADRIRKGGARQGCTLFVTLLSGFQALMCRLAGQQDVVVGIPTAGQSIEDDNRQALVGHCVNFLAVRGRLAEGTTCADFLSQSKRTLLDAYEHQSYTFGTLVRKLAIPRDPSRVPLIEVQFNLEKFGTRARFEGLEATVDSCPKAYVNFDLFLNVTETPDGLVMDLDYNTELFDEATLDRWLRHYQTLLDAATANPQQAVMRAALLTPEERVEILVDRNRTLSEFPRELCVHQLIEQQVAGTPGNIAAVFQGKTLTYAELDRRANELSKVLRTYGVGPDELVAVCMDRSLAMLLSLLAVWKAGGAYVPLDPSHPKDRLAFILKETSVRVVLTERRLKDLFTEVGSPLLYLDEPMPAGDHTTANAKLPGPQNLAYVIYTSGSTGKPKGVEIPHQAVVNFLWSMRTTPGMVSDDRLLAVTTLSFDIAGLEMFLPLICGARVVIASREDTVDGIRLANLLEEQRITVLQATPATWRMLLDSGWSAPSGLKMLCGGEALPRDLADDLLKGQGELWNMYGPTETTIWSAVCRVNGGPGPVLVGPPIANTQFYILDAFQEPMPVGVPGELFIGGDSVARGYYRRPELTMERFLSDPFRPAGRMYRTGDLARALPDGSLEFLGRLDHQVKLRGFRIELGEIEAVLARYPGVKECVASVRNHNGSDHLVAYAVSGSATVTPADLREFLRKDLPGYMIPSFFVFLTQIPRTPNGKIDRKSLPAPELARLPVNQLAAPRTELEEKIASICLEVLQLKEISTDSSLFELGADSLHVVRIVARANQAGLALSTQQVLLKPTVAGIAQSLENGKDTSSKPSLTVRRVQRNDYRLRGETVS